MKFLVGIEAQLDELHLFLSPFVREKSGCVCVCVCEGERAQCVCVRAGYVQGCVCGGWVLVIASGPKGT